MANQSLEFVEKFTINGQEFTNGIGGSFIIGNKTFFYGTDNNGVLSNIIFIEDGVSGYTTCNCQNMINNTDIFDMIEINYTDGNVIYMLLKPIKLKKSYQLYKSDDGGLNFFQIILNNNNIDFEQGNDYSNYTYIGQPYNIVGFCRNSFNNELNLITVKVPF